MQENDFQQQKGLEKAISGSVDPSQAIVKREAREIAINYARRLGYKPEKLANVITKYNFSLAQIEDLAEIRELYTTNLHTMLRLIDQGFSIEEVGEFMAVKKEMEGTNIGSPALEVMVEFNELYGSGPLEHGDILGKIEELDEIFNDPNSKYRTYSDTMFRIANSLGKEYDIANFETLCDYLTKGFPNSEDEEEAMEDSRLEHKDLFGYEESGYDNIEKELRKRATER